jgi:hypothetical protein
VESIVDPTGRANPNSAARPVSIDLGKICKIC